MFAKYKEPPVSPSRVKIIIDRLLTVAIDGITETSVRCSPFSDKDSYILADFLQAERITYTKQTLTYDLVTYNFPYPKNTLIDRIDDAFAKRYPEFYRASVSNVEEPPPYSKSI